MQVVKAGTKLGAIVAGLETFCGLKLIEEGGEYFIVKIGRETCRHRDTDHAEHCKDPANVPCSKWEHDESLTLTTETEPIACDDCITVYDSAHKKCPKCGSIPTEGITDHLVRCNHVGEHTACVQCGHSSPHVELNACASRRDHCKFIDSAVTCILIKEDN